METIGFLLKVDTKEKGHPVKDVDSKTAVGGLLRLLGCCKINLKQGVTRMDNKIVKGLFSAFMKLHHAHQHIIRSDECPFACSSNRWLTCHQPC